MKIGPLRDLEYDEPTQQITSDSHVVIEDPDMVTTGDVMRIQLRTADAQQPGGSSRLRRTEYLELFRNVHVLIHDVGKSGIMPGRRAQPLARSSH